MIAALEGVLREKSPTRVVLDVGGVGYEVLIPLTTFYELPDPGKTVGLRIHTHVREDALQLFGFRSEGERAAFALLLRTSGVGPRLAQAILSGLAPEDLVAAIRDGDVATLRGIPGVGTKTAERILVDLRDRLDELALEGGPPARTSPASRDEAADEALSALLNLGYPRSQAERAVDGAREGHADADLEALIRAALRRLAR